MKKYDFIFNNMIISKMDNYNENKFLNDFMDIYNENNEYDFTILLDDYFADFIDINSQDFLKTVYEYYNIENDEEELYERLYNLVERMICDKCESDAETDFEE